MGHADAELVSQSLAGSREAFGRIVEQYQSLICSIAYSATGSLCQSEDLAQETFVIAWKQLRQLREPEKLRSWLCSIARSAISGALRRQIREPAHAAEPMDTADESPAPEQLPSESVIQREEEAILWRSLGRIPELYREPLVLFYREQQSVASVAEQLELSEDAVKQRLSRGRKLLTEEVTAFVEGALERTNPGKAFTIGVLAALPVFATSAKAATLGATAVKGSAAAKAAASVGIFGFLFGPVLGILGGILGTGLGIAGARSPRERQFAVKTAWITWSIVLVFNLLLFGWIMVARSYWKTHPTLFAWAIIGVSFGYGISMLGLILWSRYHQSRIRREETSEIPAGAVGKLLQPLLQPYEYRSRRTLLGLPLIHIRWNCKETGKVRPAKGWIACGSVAHGVLFAYGSVAVGAVSMGGVAVGGLAMGGCALGLLTFAGLAVGMFAVGGAALGYVACGGAALGWLAANGGAAVAHDLAIGGVAFARHANDATAQAFVQHSVLFNGAYFLLNLSFLAGFLPLIPIFLRLRKQSLNQN